MRVHAFLVAAALLASGATIAFGGPQAPLATEPLAQPGLSARELLAAATWTDRLLALDPLLDGDLDAAPFEEHRSIPDLVDAVYAHLGAGLTSEDRAALAAQADALPPALAGAVRQLLGAVEQGIADWHLATAALSDAEMRLVHDWAADASDLAAAPEPPEVRAAVERIDWARIHTSTMRLAGALDAVQPMLEEAAQAAPAPSPRAAPFPGPNEGILFNDPFNLILVGDVVDSTYRGNTWPYPDSIHPQDILFILDPAGDDTYLHNPAVAGPGCDVEVCEDGLPIGLLVDAAGNDRYEPMHPSGTVASSRVAGIAVLLDLMGNDRYLTGQASQAFSAQGVALLLDAAGNDRYVGDAGAQGVSAGHRSLAVLLDLRGNDDFRAKASSQATTFSGGLGILADLNGDDVFTATEFGQAAASSGGVAFFLNAGGNDVYGASAQSRGYAGTCWDPGVGGVPSCPAGMEDWLALFLDTCGIDAYLGPIGHDNDAWQQNAFGHGADIREPVLCAGKE